MFFAKRVRGLGTSAPSTFRAGGQPFRGDDLYEPYQEKEMSIATCPSSYFNPSLMYLFILRTSFLFPDGDFYRVSARMIDQLNLRTWKLLRSECSNQISLQYSTVDLCFGSQDTKKDL